MHTWTEENVFKHPDTSNELYKRFTYTEDSFNERLRQIYEVWAQQSFAADMDLVSVVRIQRCTVACQMQLDPTSLTNLA